MSVTVTWGCQGGQERTSQYIGLLSGDVQFSAIPYNMLSTSRIVLLHICSEKSTAQCDSTTLYIKECKETGDGSQTAFVFQPLCICILSPCIYFCICILNNWKRLCSARRPAANRWFLAQLTAHSSQAGSGASVNIISIIFTSVIVIVVVILAVVIVIVIVGSGASVNIISIIFNSVAIFTIHYCHQPA